MGLQIYTIIHVIISLVGIFTGFVVAAGMLKSQRLEGWTKWFLVTTILTSVTGFFFPFTGFTPAYAFGVLSLVLLGLAVYGLYKARLAGKWRATYVGTALAAQYLNTFVLIVQLFEKVPFLNAIAPTQSSPPFGITQTLCLVGFIVLGVKATKKFRPNMGAVASSDSMQRSASPSSLPN